MASKIPESYQSPIQAVEQTTRVPFAEPIWHSRGASPYYGESHRRLQREVREYVDDKLLPFSEQWERQGSVPAEVWLSRHSSHKTECTDGIDRYWQSIVVWATWLQQYTRCQRTTSAESVCLAE
jgi:hypothetical protein